MPDDYEWPMDVGVPPFQDVLSAEVSYVGHKVDGSMVAGVATIRALFHDPPVHGPSIATNACRTAWIKVAVRVPNTEKDVLIDLYDLVGYAFPHGALPVRPEFTGEITPGSVLMRLLSQTDCKIGDSEATTSPASGWGGGLDAECVIPGTSQEVVVGDVLAWKRYDDLVETACAVFKDELVSQMYLNASKKHKGESSSLPPRHARCSSGMGGALVEAEDGK